MNFASHVAPLRFILQLNLKFESKVFDILWLTPLKNNFSPIILFLFRIVVTAFILRAFFPFSTLLMLKQTKKLKNVSYTGKYPLSMTGPQRM